MAFGLRIWKSYELLLLKYRVMTVAEMLEFEALTLAPIDVALVDTTIMTADEIDWLNSYHARVRSTITPLVDAKTSVWLEGATQPLSIPTTS